MQYYIILHGTTGVICLWFKSKICLRVEHYSTCSVCNWHFFLFTRAHTQYRGVQCYFFFPFFCFKFFLYKNDCIIMATCNSDHTSQHLQYNVSTSSPQLRHVSTGTKTVWKITMWAYFFMLEECGCMCGGFSLFCIASKNDKIITFLTFQAYSTFVWSANVVLADVRRSISALSLWHDFLFNFGACL